MASRYYGNRMVNNWRLEEKRKAEESRQVRLDRIRESKKGFTCTYYPLEHVHKTQVDATRCNDFARQQQQKASQHERERELKKMQYERERQMTKMQYDHEKCMMDKKLQALDKMQAMGITGRQLPMFSGKQTAAIGYYTDLD